MSETRELFEYMDGNTTALIILHEIYGINDFIKDSCRQYHEEGYDVFCPNLFCRQAAFPYTKAEEAYHAYRSTVGFDAYREIDLLAAQLKQRYAKVLVLGFSVGATLAWRCSESPFYDGIICCYGSRIRDYLTVAPNCPVLLIFAEQDSFDVAGTAIRLRSKKYTAVERIDGKHGFADCYSENYSQPGAALLDKLRKDFWAACTE